MIYKHFSAMAVAITLGVTTVRGGILNGDFASGNFSGWSTLVQTSASGAGAEVVSSGGEHFAQLTANPTGTTAATAAIQQAFLIGQPTQLQFDFVAELSIAGLDQGMAGMGNASIVVSQLGGSWSQNWTYTLYNDPLHSAGRLSIPLGTVQTTLPYSGTYLFYAQVQGADGPSGNNAFAQLTLGNVQLHSLSVPEPASCTLLLLGVGVAVYAGARRHRSRMTGPR